MPFAVAQLHQDLRHLGQVAMKAAGRPSGTLHGFPHLAPPAPGSPGHHHALRLRLEELPKQATLEQLPAQRRQASPAQNRRRPRVPHKLEH